MSSTQVKAAEECQIATKDLKSQQSNQKDECLAEENGKQNGAGHHEKEIKHKSPQKKINEEEKDHKNSKEHKNGNEGKTEESGTTNVEEGEDEQEQDQTTATENKESHVEKTGNGANGSTSEKASPNKKKPLEQPEVEGPEMKKARRSLESEKDADKKIDDGSEDKTAEAVKTN